MTDKMLRRLFWRHRIIRRLLDRHHRSEIASMFGLSGRRQIYGIEFNARYWQRTEQGQQALKLTYNE